MFQKEEALTKVFRYKDKNQESIIIQKLKWAKTRCKNKYINILNNINKMNKFQTKKKF
jgi:hypothetical protein